MVRLTCFALLLTASVSCIAQNRSGAGTISGTLIDSAGAVFPSARVLLLNLSTFETQKQMVGIDGKFAFHDLAPGEYAVVAADREQKSCLMPAIQRVTLKIGDTKTLRPRLVLDKNKNACLEPIT